MLSVLLLAGCKTAEQERQSHLDEINAERPTFETSEVERSYMALVGTPMILTNVEDERRQIDLYLTPSCPPCMALFYDLVNKGLIKSVSLESSDIMFAMVPRVDSDHRIIKNIFCVDAGQAFESMRRYYRAALEDGLSFGRLSEAQYMDRLTSISADTAKALGTDQAQLDACRSNNDFDKAIYAAWLRGWEKNDAKDWPFVVVDGEATSIKNSRQLIDFLKE